MNDYDRIIYVKNGRYSLSRTGKPIVAAYEKRKKIIDALEDETVKDVFRWNGDLVKIVYLNSTVKIG
jgi:predicted transcriptional regulator